MRSWYDFVPQGSGLGYSLMPDTWWWDPDCPENTIRYCVTRAQVDLDWAQRMGCNRSVQDQGCTTARPGSNPGNVYCCPRQTLQPYQGVETRREAEETGHPAHGETIGTPEQVEAGRAMQTGQAIIMLLLPLGALALFGLGAMWYLKTRQQPQAMSMQSQESYVA